MASPPPIMNVHTPTASFAIVHSVNEDSLEHLFDKLSRKSHTDFHGQRVGPGWIKYYWGGTFWNLDDDADYTIFIWRLKSSTSPSSSPNLSASASTSPPSSGPQTPTLHIHDPSAPLPVPPAYRNPAFYLFIPQPHLASPGGSVKSSSRSKGKSGAGKSQKSKKGVANGGPGVVDTPKYKKEFEKFHSENGVRTVMGSIGPVHNVRMLLKSGYRHVYISRKFAMKHGFIPSDAAPGHYGYGGLINIGTWPITLQPLGSSSLDTHHNHHHNDNPDQQGGGPSNYPGQGDLLGGPNNTKNGKQSPKSTPIPVYLSEEPHFDVVLGRSFFERRQIKTNPTDPTEVVCLDTGERVEVEVVVLKDGRGEIVIVT